MPCRIAIDGPAGSGKTSVAKLLAKKLGFYYLDTGAMYRIVGLYLKNKNIDEKSHEEIEKELKKLNIQFKEGHFLVNGKEVSDEIRTPEVGIYASRFASVPIVRKYLTELQRKISLNENIVVEGRDIGTVVIPDAEVKIFLTATQEARAKRRYKELTNRGVKVNFEDILNEIILRDKQDSEREIAPLMKAKDAIEIDSTEYSLEEVVDMIYEVVKEKCKL
ncbi:(d)CMP kinase [Thermosipho atlanticus]|uniref:Cytidylate kinase n=1 Tax=Thermosipho atlanticus DSM 15807 TaxID=1123380 RepID=A0A1M5R924_9BACT|nr:(d)CMP kinase [Thermosipho atlanticus]SHH22867.1 cytidylate kinase [Thermosipho atlanticus DSM 15807]